MFERLNAIDTLLFTRINALHSPFWDQVMWFVSGKLEWLPVYLILLIYIIVKFQYRSIFILFTIAILVTLTDVISAQVIKELVKRPRPSHVDELSSVIHLVNNYHGGKYGFVSNHAANFFGLATFLSLLFRNWKASLVLLAWASLVSYSRIYIGVHYPGDILGGILLGVFFAFACYIFLLWVNQLVLKKPILKIDGESS